MIRRFQRIQSEFGTTTLLKTLLLLFGLAGMGVMGIVMFQRFDAATIASAGLVLGALLHKRIAQRVELLPTMVNLGLFTYSVVLFMGDRLGIDRPMKLIIITLTTVLVFNLQFWSLSDPDVYNPERKSEKVSGD